jgi:hypothetical protein
MCLAETVTLKVDGANRPDVVTLAPRRCSTISRTMLSTAPRSMGFDMFGSTHEGPNLSTIDDLRLTIEKTIEGFRSQSAIVVSHQITSFLRLSCGFFVLSRNSPDWGWQDQPKVLVPWFEGG